MARGSTWRGRGRGHSRGRGFSHNGGRPDMARANDDWQEEVDQGNVNSSLPERFRQNFRPPSAPMETMYNNGYRLELNLGLRKYVEAQDKIAEENQGQWPSLPDIPTREEIVLSDNENVSVPANKIKGKWKSKDKYLRAHYELLREDSVSPLREAVDAVRNSPEMLDSNVVAIYEKVYIRGFTFARGGPAARITFSTARAGCKINWQSSSRLVSGSILALTPAKDNFKSKCVIAIVAARPKVGLECTPPEIDLYFSSPEDVEIDPQVEWLMVEPKKGYYEANRHTMRALQKLQGEHFPLHERICFLNANLEAPSYVNPDVDLNLSAVITDVTKKESLEKVNIINNWPAAPQGYLDDTQWDAMRQILTKDLSIIQGPPGTGKTYVSKVALQILFENRTKGDPPIIVAAQTNHALDQLLKHISKFDSEYIRLGGRSTDEDVKKRALFEIRQANRLPPVGTYGVAKKRLDQQAQVLMETLEAISPRHSRNPFSAADLHNLNVISKDQADSLVNGALEWVTGGTEATNETKVWLGKSLMPWSLVYKEENFGFEEAEDDLEFEQLREHETESGQTDQEDIELLKGHYSPVEQHHTVQTPSPAILIKAKKELDLTADLWKIPQALRGPVYFVMQEKAKIAMTVRFREHVRVYNKICKDLKIGIFERDAVYLSKANIIGLTTTGLSKYRPLIASMKPKIILIEEAAEVIEAPVTAACVESLEHLILVGDHKQLQGHCAVEELGRSPYNLNVSMFERLVDNGIPFKTLLCQRRMDPDFRQLLRPIYPELQDHSSVVARDPLPPYGMGNVKSFFLDHDWPELRDAQMSVYNDKEALFVAGFYEYLLMGKVHPSKITILTFYNGQRKRILKYIRDRPFCKEEYHNVKTVDGYQGEENDIVILSLVRNNQKSIGFLNIENRICVALSRAKFGFYIFGNAECLRAKSDLWAEVFTTLKDQSPLRVGTALPVQCNKHGRLTLVEYPEDWSNNQPGCDLPCGETLDCGHACKWTCHPFEHSFLNCLNPCERKLQCGHPCQKKCFEPCFCDCAESDTRNNQDPEEDGSGRRGLFNNRPPDRVEKKEDAWGSSGNYDNGTTDTAGATGDEDWGSGAPGTDWNIAWCQRQPAKFHHISRKSHHGFRQRMGPSQFLARLPICSVEQQAVQDRLLTTDTAPPLKPLVPVSRTSRPSSSSSNSQPRSRSSVTGYTFGHDSQHSSEKQEEARKQWRKAADGGVKIDDEERAKARTLELKKMNDEARHDKFRTSTAFLLEMALPRGENFMVPARNDGKNVYKGNC